MMLGFRRHTMLKTSPYQRKAVLGGTKTNLPTHFRWIGLLLLAWGSGLCLAGNGSIPAVVGVWAILPGVLLALLSLLLPSRPDQPETFIEATPDESCQSSANTDSQRSQRLEELGRLAGGIAHDFNNQLHIITGYTELLAYDESLSDSARTMAQEILQACEQGAQLTGQLLAFSGKGVLRPRLTNLNTLVTRIVRTFSGPVGKDVHISLETTPAPVNVLVDPGQMHQVLINLLVNAKDAMPQGGFVWVRTRTVPQLPPEARRRSCPGGYATITVADTGEGMPPEVLANAFKPYYTTKEPGKGTGLGLPIVYGIVEQSQGYVSLESEAGQGTRVTLYFPLVEGEPEEITEANVSKPAPKPVGNETVLLVEDEEKIRKLAREALTSRGYRIIEARSGVEAIQEIASYSGPIHLLVTDVVMPFLNGVALAEQLTQKRPQMKTLFVSGGSGSAMARYGLSHHAVLLHKPYKSDALLEQVRRILDEVETPSTRRGTPSDR